MKALYGKTNPTPEEFAQREIQFYGGVVEVKPEKEEYYRELHANTWESILHQIEKSNIRNFCIYATEIEGKRYLFSHFEYHGTDFAADCAAMAADPETQRWWAECIPCMKPLPGGDPWKPMEMVFLGCT